jgi:hypothetical protein
LSVQPPKQAVFKTCGTTCIGPVNSVAIFRLEKTQHYVGYRTEEISQSGAFYEIEIKNIIARKQ